MEALAERLEALEHENAELRSKVTTLEGSGTRRERLAEMRGSETLLDGEAVSALEGRVSRRSLLSKAGAAAVAAVAAGALLPREARADHWSDDYFEADLINCHTLFAGPPKSGFSAAVIAELTSNDKAGVKASNHGGGPGVQGYSFSGTAVRGMSPEGTGVEGNSSATSAVGVEGTATGNLAYGVRGTGWFGVWGESDRAGGYGVTGRNTNTDGTGVRGVANHTDGRTGVRGEGATGVWGNSSKTGYSGVYGQHTGSMGYGVVGDGKGNGAGVLGRNNSGVGYEAFGVKGETEDAIGVKGIGRNGVVGESPAGGHGAVYGRHTGSLGYGVVGDGRGNASGVLGRNDTGTGVTGRGEYGGWFEGTKAQLKLKPAASAGVPGGAHTKGEIYMDSTGTLFVCVKGGNPAEWKKLSATAV